MIRKKSLTKSLLSLSGSKDIAALRNHLSHRYIWFVSEGTSLRPIPVCS